MRPSLSTGSHHCRQAHRSARSPSGSSGGRSFGLEFWLGLAFRSRFWAAGAEFADQVSLRAGVPDAETGCRLDGVAFGFGHADALETGHMVLVWAGPGARYLRFCLAVRALPVSSRLYQPREGAVAGWRTCRSHPASSSLSGPVTERPVKQRPGAGRQSEYDRQVPTVGRSRDSLLAAAAWQAR
jgi:hypothetical protein